MWKQTTLAALLLGCGTVSVTVTEDAGSDAGPRGPTVDVLGTWHECGSSLTYGADGTVTVVSHRERGCEARGTYVVVGDVVTTTWTEPGCGWGPTSRPSRVIPGRGGMTWIDVATGSARQRADDATGVTLFRIEGTEAGGAVGVTIASVVGDPREEFGSGCYWSEDGECGGVFSCTGSVVQWTVETDRLNANTSCGGGCPCGAVVQGRFGADGALSGDYRGANCDRSYEGTFTATRIGP